MKTKLIIGVFLLTLLPLFSCDEKKLSLNHTNAISIQEIIEEFASHCNYNLIYDEKTKKALKTKIENIHIDKLTLFEILNSTLLPHNIFYTINANNIHIQYIYTKNYNFDYIATYRSSKSSTDINIQSYSGNDNSFEVDPNLTAGAKIQSGDNFSLWGDKLNADIHYILNRPEDSFKTQPPLINKEAGIITITATYNQHKRADEYLKLLQSKLNNQVLIDLKIYSVELNNENQTGIDWEQIGNILDFQSTLSGTTSTPIINLGQTLNFNNLLAFLRKNGSVKSISNPKLLTLNNQPAIISVGKEIYYKLTQSTTTTTTSTTTQNSESVQSVFAGILLDVTPSISQNGSIILKINPSISSLDSYSSTAELRTMPPDLNKKQLSSVIKLKDKDSIILGGLIDSNTMLTTNKIPILGDIWLLGWLFKSEVEVVTNKELVIVITPHIIKNEKIKTDYKLLKDIS